MNLSIRTAVLSELPEISEIYAHARAFMRQSGNPNQWKDSHPAQSILLDDIARRQLYVCTEANNILAVFAYIPGEDPTYRIIKNGGWLNDHPYGVIHRIAVARHQSGVATFCFQWALEQCPDLRIDTHRDNIPMRSALAKNGFTECGIIYLANGDPRIAFHKTR